MCCKSAEIIPPASMQRYPLALSEKRNHSKCLMIFCIFMILYAGIAIYAFFNDHTVTNETHNKITKYIIRKIKMYLNLVDTSFTIIVNQYVGTNSYTDSRFSFSFFQVVSLITSLLCIPIMRKIPNIIIKIMIVKNVLTYVTSIAKLTLIVKYQLDDMTNLNFLILNVFCIWDFFIVLYSFYHLGVKLISEVIKESCRAIISSSYLILLTLLSSILISLVANLTFHVYAKLNVIETVTPTQGYLIILKYINFISGLWLISFIWNFTKIVCAKIFSTWFYNTYKPLHSYSTSEESIVTMLRYHLGTVAYISSLGAVFIFIITVIKNLRNKARETRYSIFVLIICYWNMFWTLYDGSCVMIAMERTNFKKSADSACQIYLKNPLFFYATTKGNTWSLAGVMIFFHVIYGIIFGIKEDGEIMKLSEEENYIFLMSIYCLMFPAILLFELAASTITICILKEFKYDIQSLTKPNFTNAKLRDLLITKIL